MIANRDLNYAGTICLRPHHDFAFLRRRLLHGVEGVHQKIENHLLQLHSVASHIRQAILAVELDVNVMKNFVAVEQLDDLADHARNMDRRKLKVLLF